MNESHKLISKITVESVIIAAAMGVGMAYPAQAYDQAEIKNQHLSTSFIVSVEFNPPGDEAPQSTSSGGTRGQVRFSTTGDPAPKSSTGGSTHAEVIFTPPGAPAPNNSTGGGTRGTFKPPGESTPDDSSSGGSRNPIIPGTSTSSKIDILIPLIPKTHHGRTVSARPTIFVYVPEMSARQVFFSLQDEDRNTIYQTTLKVSGQAGIVSFTLPPEAPELEIGKNYRWFFAPIETGGVLQPDNYRVSAWIKRVEVPTDAEATSDPIKQATLFAGSGIWYDTLDILNSAKKAQPNNTALTKEWKELLEQVGLKNIADYSVVERL